ncbi:probable beta-D-xylosidase 6 [Phoenix dactylifera]|uniref:Probable beta-D-xylosidase 6 n=1 Tax=Phoenix dactylifera TaxID=42345 RepID=A0A8B7CD86_PHODC|nr:probable beta-D-xylosidase 6 [Phoenix dactylifera]
MPLLSRDCRSQPPRCLHLLLLLLLLFSLSHPPIAAAGGRQYPCKRPHNSYPFCNASLPVATRAGYLVSLLTLDEKIQQLSNSAAAVPRLGLPPYQWWSESLHGLAPNGPGVFFNGTVRSATVFPQVIVSAAAFNRTLWHAISRAIAVEARAMYNVGQAGLTFWAPNINIFRDPRWGRGQETPGEDPMLTSDYAVEYVRGFQGEDDGDLEDRIGKSRISEGSRRRRGGGGAGEMMVSACCKHYTAYDLDQWENFSRYTFNAAVTKQDMEDTFQPPFRSCIEEGHASCLMCSYNQVNGVPACARGDLLQKARKEWGLEGYITSDCDAVAIIYEDQNYTKSPEDSIADVLKAGMDINCGTYLVRYTGQAVRLGIVREEDIDRALLNLFSVQLRLGLFDGNPAKNRFGELGPSNICTKEHRELALEAARQGIVLLKNDRSFLPLRKNKVGSLAIIGPAGNDTNILGGDYTGVPCHPTSLFEGLQTYVAGTSFAAGCIDVPCDLKDGFKAAVAVARKADVVVVVAGLNLTEETEDHDRISLLLPGEQMDLVNAIAKVSRKPLVLVLMGGGPVDVSFAKDNPRIGSILWIGYPGEVGGQAVAEALFGEFNPGGRLPVTWYPESFTKVPMNDMHMRADPSRRYPGRTYRFYTGEVVYRFGYGLSYSSYSYKFFSVPEKISVRSSSTEAYIRKEPQDARRDGLDSLRIDEISSCKALTFYVQISVINGGNMDGSNTVLLFARSTANIKGSPKKQLIGFERVHTTAGRATEARIMVNPCKHLSTVNEEGQWVLPLGAHVLMVEDLEHVLVIEA